MFVNYEIFPKRNKSVRSGPPKYSLKDFSLPEYRDPVVPVQIMMVMMGFTILLLNSAFSASGDRTLVFVALISAVPYLLSFMFYLTEYYEKLWEPYFLLPEDKLFFRFYSVLVGIVVIALMGNWPEYWPSYIIFLFVIMYLKKRKVRATYHAAVQNEYGSYEACSDDKVKSCYILVDTFTRNFASLGIIPLLPIAMLMSISALLISNAQWLSWLNTQTTFAISSADLRTLYSTTSIIASLGTVVFWAGKINTGLIEMKSQIEMGHYAYFETRDLRSRFRRGRYTYKG